jgi:hypothetical protein
MKYDPTPDSPDEAISGVAHVSLRDSARNTLRPMVEALDHRMAAFLDSVAPADRAAATMLRTSWQALVDTLALGPAPEMRACPVCAHHVMRAASLCDRCWSKISPLAAH